MAELRVCRMWWPLCWQDRRLVTVRILYLIFVLWVPKRHATWAYAPRRPWGQCPRVAVGGGFARGRPCDDFRLVGLKLIFLIVTRAVSVLGLSRREAWWKDAEIRG